ncbi:hypothetical protein GCM10010372_82970 [Streptomyces tauricus]|nr:hypothetical protein GCM10010372_82970 [Streptomyces tauricus]
MCALSVHRRKLPEMDAHPVGFSDTPIYSQLVAERGDVPGRTRDEAEQLHRLLEPLFNGTSAAERAQRVIPQRSFFGAGPRP